MIGSMVVALGVCGASLANKISQPGMVFSKSARKGGIFTQFEGIDEVQPALSSWTKSKSQSIFESTQDIYNTNREPHTPVYEVIEEVKEEVEEALAAIEEAAEQVVEDAVKVVHAVEAAVEEKVEAVEDKIEEKIAEVMVERSEEKLLEKGAELVAELKKVA